MNTNPSAIAHVSREFNAPPERVFDAWLDPAWIGRWMFGPAVRGEEIVGLSTDARVGGAFSFVVRRQGREIDHIGEYLELARPHHLVFTWSTRDSLPASSRVTIDITPAMRGCELTLRHELPPAWAGFVDRTGEAWRKMFTVLASALA